MLAGACLPADAIRVAAHPACPAACHRVRGGALGSL